MSTIEKSEPNDKQFSGETNRTANNWLRIININEYANKPINYLEIGAFHGVNLVSVANSYAKHPDSTLHAVDPWDDYDEYPEYKGQQCYNYSQFSKTIENSGHKDKITVHRGYSNQIVPTFDDEYFDIIYVDGNHEPEYVLEDAVLSFRKLKPGGIMIFDDYGWGGPDLTQRGINGFLNGYHKRLVKIGVKETQVFVKKANPSPNLLRFRFYRELDGIGDDICSSYQLNIEKLAELALNTPNCVAFNTVGYLKSNIEKLVPSTYFDGLDGIYIIDTFDESLKAKIK